MPASRFFDCDGAASDPEVGVARAKVRMLARVRGWSTDVCTDYPEGTEIVVWGATIRREQATTVEAE